MKEVSQERLIKDTRRVLENPFWIPGLDIKVFYERLHDDHDGTFKGKIIVCLDEHGDVYVGTDKSPLLRFRNDFGGGMSLRVRNALMILAWAIKLDNEKRPQEQSKKE